MLFQVIFIAISIFVYTFVRTVSFIKYMKFFFIFIEQKKHWCYKIKFYLVNTKMNFIDIVNLRSNKR